MLRRAVLAAAALSAAATPAAARAQSTGPQSCTNRPQPAILQLVRAPVGALVPFDVGASPYPGCDEAGDPGTVTVSWGDGASTPAGVVVGGPTVPVAHAYAAAGTFGAGRSFRNDRTGVSSGQLGAQVDITPVAAEQRASSGAVLAILRAQEGKRDGTTIREAKGTTLEVLRDGALARAAAGLDACRHGCAPSGEMAPYDTKPVADAGVESVRAADLTGDGEPEVLVDRADGFNVCCTAETAIYTWDPATGRYAELDARLGSAVSVRSGLLVGDDVRFYAKYAPRAAGVFLPVRVWALRGGAPADVTTEHPELVKPAVPSLTKLLNGLKTKRGAAATLSRKTLLPALLADLRRLGRREDATATLAAERKAGRVTKAYAASVTKLLARLGY